MRPDEAEARCVCGEDLWAVRGGEWTLKSRILIWRNGGFIARCDVCRREVAVPFLTLTQPPSTGTTSATRRMIAATIPPD